MARLGMNIATMQTDGNFIAHCMSVIHVMFVEKRQIYVDIYTVKMLSKSSIRILRSEVRKPESEDVPR